MSCTKYACSRPPIGAHASSSTRSSALVRDVFPNFSEVSSVSSAELWASSSAAALPSDMMWKKLPATITKG